MKTRCKLSINLESHTGIYVLLLFSQVLVAQSYDLPSPLSFNDIPELAKEQRAEIQAARERINASQQRETILSGLEDPMVSPSIDHWPYGMPEADVSLGIEQRFPFSRIRGQQRRSAQAQTSVSQFETVRTTLDIQVDATNAFLMLYERRRMQSILQEQRELVAQIVASVNARYQSGSAGSTQADVIRAEVELARLDARLRSIQYEITASEAMLNASLGRPADLSIPALVYNADSLSIYSDSLSVIKNAITQRPEIAIAQARIEGASAQVAVMRSMYWPMLTVRGGPAYTMQEGSGLMFMLGVSVPIWRGKLKAGVEEAKAMERMARADLEAMQRMVEGEAVSAYNNMTAENARYVLLRDDVLARVNQSISPTLSGYAAGLLPLVSVIEAVRMLLMTQEDLLEAEVSIGTAWVRLRRATGSLEREINE